MRRRELFSDFYVGASGRAKGGIGLGLAITKEIVHAHGGQVEAKPSDSGGSLCHHNTLEVAGILMYFISYCYIG
ncbi:MAG: hypothetical protein MZU79_00070 [Anaerotruncus sp.]|nr:hypothetical protein [Anaerotruncus sp.]